MSRPATQTVPLVPNYIGGKWHIPAGREARDVTNPATAELLARVPLSSADEVDKACRAAAHAFEGWRRTPAGERVQPLFKLKSLLEESFEELSRTITDECGKTLSESRGEMRRAIENVETACGIPILMQGYNSEDIASGIDETMIRQPLGVCAIIAPFNFPGMIPFWFLPYAVACGNTCVIKPSERVPLTMQKVFSLLENAGLPEGVLNLINGARETVDALVDHPLVRSVSLVGSSSTARHVYGRAAANGKRVQCQGGAKNAVVILPDADMEMAAQIVADSAFGCAGQRCLAASLAIPVGDARQPFTEAIAHQAESRRVGYGAQDGIDMGPVISAESRERIETMIGAGVDEGARPIVDGRKPRVDGFENGYFIRPTVLDELPPESPLGRTEIFGPVLGVMHTSTVDKAINFINSGTYGNMACLFTASGAAARKFRYEVEAGNVGINVGVAAPIASFPFSGAKESFFGDLHGQGRDAVEFFTQKKVVVERWPREWSRRF